MNSDILINILLKQRDEIKNKIDNYKKYNQINKVRRKIVKTGIAIDYAFPLILSFIILLNISKKTNNNPFIIDDIEETENLELIDTSNGYHEENKYYEESIYPKIEYSESWKVNEYGLFERKVTSYIIYNIDINDKENILSMNKEEIENNLIPLSENIYTKTSLDEKDKIFLEDSIILTRVKETDNKKIIKETKEENALYTLIYISLFLIIEKCIKNIKRIIIRDKIKNKLEETHYKYREIDEEELKTLKDILKIREENIKMIKTKKKEYNHEKHVR